MVNIKIKGKKYQCPNRWEDVKNIGDLISCETLIAEISALTGCDELNDIPVDQLFPFITLTSFLEELDFPEIQCADVNDGSYYTMQKARGVITANIRAYKKLAALSHLYHPERTETMQVLSTGANILSQITLFLAAYEDMFSYEPEKEEIEAGIEELGVFGDMATLYNLANKDISQMEDLGNAPAVLIYGILFYNFRMAEYQKRLDNIKHPPKKE